MKTNRKPPRCILRRPTDPLKGAIGMVLFGRDVEGTSALFVCARVGQVRKLPTRGYELATCQECGADLWINSEAVETTRRRGMEVVAVCSDCGLGGAEVAAVP